MGWNHRIVRTVLGNCYTRLAVHEVYYDPAGRAESVTLDPVCPLVNETDGETLGDLVKELALFAKAATLPILNMEEIPEFGVVSSLLCLPPDEDES